MEGVPNHLAAHKTKDDEGDDAGIALDDLGHKRTGEEAQKRHEALERTEEDGHEHGPATGQATMGKHV